MTRIDFYVEAPDRLEVACRLAAKALQADARMLIFVPDEALLARLNKQLWMQPAIGFVPHCLAHEPIAAETPILLARSVDDPPIDDILLNLASEWPPTFGRFRRLIEVVSRNDEDKAAARERYRFYRDRGYAIETYNLSASARPG